MLAPFSKNLDALYTAKNIFSLLARLIHGEEKSNHLFAVIESWYRFISSDSGEKADLKTAEVLIVLRILYVLGYFKKSPALAAFAEETEISKEILSDFKKEQIHATKEINAALKETHL